MYIQSLKLGAKCIERNVYQLISFVFVANLDFYSFVIIVDTWDGPKGEPMIYHGHTLVSHISFTDTLVAIRDYAFIKSEYYF